MARQFCGRTRREFLWETGAGFGAVGLASMFAADEARGRSASFLAPPERGDETVRIVQAIKRGEIVQPFETERVRKDGRRI